jgi:hypothetical protein
MARWKILAFALVWSFIVTIVCVGVGIGAFRQVVCTYWSRAQGVVTVSEPKDKSGNNWNVQYTYLIAGREYTGTRYAYEPMDIQGKHEVLRHVSAYPVGAAVVVSYNPANPAEAVLRPGLRGCTLWVALVLTPFVIVGLGLWRLGLFAGPGSLAAFDSSDPRQVSTLETGVVVVRVRRPRWPVIFLACLGLATFVVGWVLFFVGLTLGVAYWMFKGFLLDPPLVVPATVWALLLIGCALVTSRAVRRLPDLVVDLIREVIYVSPREVPQFQMPTAIADPISEVIDVFRRGVRPVEMPLAALGNVSVTEHTYGGQNGKFVFYRVDVACAEGGAALVVAEYDDLPDAEGLADWLRRQLSNQPVP